jgi:hypothetical protein
MTGYPPDEWRIAGELIRQIGSATTWQRVIEAGDALMNVSRMAKSLRDEQNQDFAQGAAISAMTTGAQAQGVAGAFDLGALRGIRNNGAGY